jgi:hypothetical protein
MNNFGKNIEQNIIGNPENKETPGYKLMVSRHGDPLLDGNLAPAGIEGSMEKGKKLGKSAEVLKGYASDIEPNRAYLTSELIAEASEINSPSTGKRYKTRRKKGIQYNVLEPDLMGLLKKASKVTDDVTIRELGLAEGTVLKDLPKEEQERIDPIRQKNIKFGFRELHPEAIHRMSIGLAHQLAHEMKLISLYNDLRKEENKPLEKDVILNTVTHGMFPESLFLEAGYIKTRDGSFKKISKDDIDSPNFGGLFLPSEFFLLEIKDPKNIPNKIPVIFGSEGRPEEGATFMDKKRLLELADEYKELKK